MKKTLLALAIFGLAGSAFACIGPSCTPSVPNPGSAYSTGSATGANYITSGSTATASSIGTGTSTSYSSNTTTATSLVNLTGNKIANVAPNCDALVAGSVAFTGQVSTSSQSLAYNVSTGTATGSAQANGFADAKVSGNALFVSTNPQGQVYGNVVGTATSHTQNYVSAGANQGGYATGANIAGFTLTSAASLATQSPVTAGSCGGYNCGPATADQKTATTSVLAYSNNSPSTGVTNGIFGLHNAFVTNSSTGSATGSAYSQAIGGVSTPLVSVAPQ
jgi:hypothetical protein